MKIKEKCPECGSDDLEFKAWVDNEEKFVEHVDESENSAWCRKCQDHVVTEPI